MQAARQGLTSRNDLCFAKLLLLLYMPTMPTELLNLGFTHETPTAAGLAGIHFVDHINML